MFQRFSNETLSTIYVIQSCDRMKIFLFSLKIKFIFYGRFGRILINIIYTKMYKFISLKTNQILRTNY